MKFHTYTVNVHRFCLLADVHSLVGSLLDFGPDFLYCFDK